ncbi:hypothetical protein M404DRAFT_95770, partial [Pisolithus tinctorius Marx 270]
AYAFTDYCAQAETLKHCMVEIGTPPTGQITPFNTYVALSHSQGCETIHLLRDFNIQLCTQHPSKYLWREDEHLEKLDVNTKWWWQ